MVAAPSRAPPNAPPRGNFWAFGSTTIEKITLGEDELDLAFPPLSVVMTLEDDIDLSRGEMLVRKNNQPQMLSEVDAKICWLDSRPLNPSVRLIIRHMSHEVRAKISEVLYRIDINTLHRDEENRDIAMNDIARVRIKTASPILADPYRTNRTTGAFILVDPSTHATVAAGVIG